MLAMRLSAFAPSTSSAVGWRYSRTAVVLHWLLAVLITLTTIIGWRMMLTKRQPGSEQLFDLHKSIGLIISAFVLARVVWRLSHRPEPLPGGPTWSSRLAAIAHVVLYVLMVLLPITGYLGASYSKAGVRWFGLATPRWALADHDLAERYFTIHGVLGGRARARGGGVGGQKAGGGGGGGENNQPGRGRPTRNASGRALQTPYRQQDHGRRARRARSTNEDPPGAGRWLRRQTTRGKAAMTRPIDLCGVEQLAASSASR